MVLQRVTPRRPEAKQNRVDVFEVIPDSEEDRQQCTTTPLKQPATTSTQLKGDLTSTTSHNLLEVIEISSDSDDSDSDPVSLIPQTPHRPKQNSTKTPRSTRIHYSRSRIIESSDDDSEPEIIELTDDSDDAPFSTPSTSHTHVFETPESPSRNEAIIVFDEPRSARRPLRLQLKTTENFNDHNYLNDLSTVEHNPRLLIPTTPSTKKVPAVRKTGKPAEDTPRPKSKKAQTEAEQRRRHDYAQQLFTDLNLSIFKQGLPVDTKLNWNKRLLTTAGRAKFHRSRDGVQTTEIELAEKILDCDERIRNTLSHEMCHLATWVIDKKVDEHHGKLFKSWAHKVMLKRPDIHVSIRHNYEISHPFQWKCAKCAKVYGRFSKSIKPSECVCGACKEGTLIPLFPVKAAANRDNSKLSRLAASKPQESPRTIAHNSQLGELNSDSDIELLAGIMASTRLG